MFYSILFKTKNEYERERFRNVPECFKDLNLHKIFEVILKDKEEFELEGLFYTPLQDEETIIYRQEIMADLEDDDFRKVITSFSKTIYKLNKIMEKIDRQLISIKSYENNYLTCGRMLDCADVYCREIYNLLEILKGKKFYSQGLNAFKEYIGEYIKSDKFQELKNHVLQLRKDLSSVEYCMFIKGGTIRIRKYQGEIDYSKKILDCFEKFRQGKVKDYRKKLDEEPVAAHVENGVLNILADLYKDIFADLRSFCEKHRKFLDHTIIRFAVDIQFYLSWLEYVQRLKKVGLPFHYPKFSKGNDAIFVRDTFDLALAYLIGEKTITNDFILNPQERVIVVTGPNQGGKTTFARAIGQIHYLASLGLSVPGREGRLPISDQILTHFNREEDLSTLQGKLQDDLVRLKDILKKATERSIIIINEIFASTTLSDAIILGRNMLKDISVLGSFAVIVTFIEELATNNYEIVSMVGVVDKNDPTQRTYKFVRKPPDGLAYALHIAKKYNLTYEDICRRLKNES
ncbi:MutS-related protein [Anaerobranca gottschalkii]|uniref:MutS-related protein n=1 Tax=Anaerobranca gottschalkii TaxID=108328 RepID=UPI000B884000|nr:hypothetical protein [Anaerobranca gottschalkii]